jgi:hypothetical protein
MIQPVYSDPNSHWVDERCGHNHAAFNRGDAHEDDRDAGPHYDGGGRNHDDGRHDHNRELLIVADAVTTAMRTSKTPSALHCNANAFHLSPFWLPPDDLSDHFQPAAF